MSPRSNTEHTEDYRYARTAFIPADQPGFSAVTVYAADGETVLGVISTAQLRARPSPFDGNHAPPVERAAARAFYPSVSPTSRRKPHTPVRRQKQAA